MTATHTELTREQIEWHMTNAINGDNEISHLTIIKLCEAALEALAHRKPAGDAGELCKRLVAIKNGVYDEETIREYCGKAVALIQHLAAQLEAAAKCAEKMPYVTQYESYTSQAEKGFVPTKYSRLATPKEVAAAIRALFIPPDADGMVVVPREPTEAMWGNDLVRLLIRWCGETRPVPESLRFNLLHGYGPVPDWIEAEPEFQNKGHVVSKGTRATMIYRAMIAAYEK